MPTTVENDARIDLRLPTSAKSAIEKAASLQGVSVSNFVLSNAHNAALEVIQAVETISLNKEDSRRLVQNLLNPPAPNAALEKLMQSRPEDLIQ